MSMTILAVDDSSSVRQLINSTLEQVGYRVVLAGDGRDGLDKLPQASPDLIVTDLHMPILDGIGFINEVRANPSFRFVPIIILTTEYQNIIKQAAVAAGATAWITKPFRAEELLAVIKKVMRQC